MLGKASKNPTQDELNPLTPLLLSLRSIRKSLAHHRYGHNIRRWNTSHDGRRHRVLLYQVFLLQVYFCKVLSSSNTVQLDTQ